MTHFVCSTVVLIYTLILALLFACHTGTASGLEHGQQPVEKQHLEGVIGSENDGPPPRVEVGSQDDSLAGQPGGTTSTPLQSEGEVSMTDEQTLEQKSVGDEAPPETKTMESEGVTDNEQTPALPKSNVSPESPVSDLSSDTSRSDQPAQDQTEDKETASEASPESSVSEIPSDSSDTSRSDQPDQDQTEDKETASEASPESSVSDIPSDSSDTSRSDQPDQDQTVNEKLEQRTGNEESQLPKTGEETGTEEAVVSADEPSGTPEGEAASEADTKFSESQPQSQLEGDQGKQEEEEEEEEEIPRVSYIPELSANIMNPGRLMNASWFILFYAPWCEFSEAAQPQFLETIQSMLDNNITGVYVGKIDVSKHGDVLKHFKVKSTPTFLFFHKGVKYEFQEEVNVEKLKNFMLTIVRADVKRVNTTQQLADLQQTNPVLFLLVHEGEEEFDRDWHSAYSQVAREQALRGKFLYTTNPELVKDYHFTSFPLIAVIKDGRSTRFSEALSAYSLTRWISSERITAFPTVNASTIWSYLKLPAGRRLIVLVVDEDPSQRRIAQKKAIEVVRKVALGRHLKRGFQFILLEGVEVAEKMLQQRSLELPVLFAYELRSGYFYMYQPGEDEKGMTEKSVVSFFERVRKGAIQRGGGPTYQNTLTMVWWRLYTTTQAMITHRPLLSLATIVSLLAVVLFYFTIWCQRKPKQVKRPPRSAVIRRQQAARGGQTENSVRSRGRRGQTGEGSSSGTESLDQSQSEPETNKDK